ncbi:hypothetical protein TNCT_514451 [Trichonephila clavata]|uniref:Uncharacterized protein n=1 Tax=Trichonephila clavata TaxID=2740835 RepID=A0A8X6G8H4_TRICU|nr:hypothetical protein TNCT_514451 [Trichonephila clavata]
MTSPMNMGLLRMKNDRFQYPFIPLSIQPVLHSADMPFPDSPRKHETVNDYVEEEFSRPGTTHDPVSRQKI